MKIYPIIYKLTFFEYLKKFHKYPYIQGFGVLSFDEKESGFIYCKSDGTVHSDVGPAVISKNIVLYVKDGKLYNDKGAALLLIENNKSIYLKFTHNILMKNNYYVSSIYYNGESNLLNFQLMNKNKHRIDLSYDIIQNENDKISERINKIFYKSNYTNKNKQVFILNTIDNKTQKKLETYLSDRNNKYNFELYHKPLDNYFYYKFKNNKLYLDVKNSYGSNIEVNITKYNKEGSHDVINRQNEYAIIKRKNFILHSKNSPAVIKNNELTWYKNNKIVKNIDYNINLEKIKKLYNINYDLDYDNENLNDNKNSKNNI